MVHEQRLRLGGVSGVAAAFILIPATIMNLMIPDPGLAPIDNLLKTLSTPFGRAALVFNSAIFIAGGLALIGFFLGLFDSLKDCGYSLFGCVFGIVGSSLAAVIFGTQALMFSRLGASFAVATESQKALLLFLGSTAQGVILGGFALFTLFMGVALLSLGVCMNRCVFGRVYGWSAIIMAVFIMLSLIPGFVFLYLTFFAIYVWFILVGLKLLGLSHAVK